MPNWTLITDSPTILEALANQTEAVQALTSDLPPKNCVGIYLSRVEAASYWPWLESFSGLIFSNGNLGRSDVILSEQAFINQWPQLCRLLEKVHCQHIKLISQQQLNTEMTEIGIALSAEKHLPNLLAMILTEGRKLAQCEAASLYLVEQEEQESYLRFMLFQNEKLDVPFAEKRYPLNHRSMAGHCALTGEVLNIADVYQIPQSAPYVFDDGFDRAYGYRTREVLTLPMTNHKNDIIGILQFLNLKVVEQQHKPFDNNLCQLLLALASQSAVAIDNSLLIENIRDLFEGFVSAAVTAIEARDPITSGHSFRVADYTTGIAEKLSLAPAFKSKILSVDEMRELRYAALLHDFGKVGVREHILQKAKKLAPIELELIKARLNGFQHKLSSDFYQQAFIHSKNSSMPPKWFEQYHAELESKIKQIQHYLTIIEEVNEPSILKSDNLEKLNQLRAMSFDWKGKNQPLLLENEFLSLSVNKGSLTQQERDEIQSHVNHTFEFLKRIPWTSDLKNIPFIASAHHEKLDGSGYPFGLNADDIPIQTRMMTIADIYDALTASDRPYKAALPYERALNILSTEAKEGKLDSNLVKLFIDAKVYQINE